MTRDEMTVKVIEALGPVSCSSTTDDDLQHQAERIVNALWGTIPPWMEPAGIVWDKRHRSGGRRYHQVFKVK